MPTSLMILATKCVMNAYPRRQGDAVFSCSFRKSSTNCKLEHGSYNEESAYE